MGPRPFGRGNFFTHSGTAWLCELQWGRDRSVAETAGTHVVTRDYDALQWGRDRSVAETSFLFEV